MHFAKPRSAYVPLTVPLCTSERTSGQRKSTTPCFRQLKCALLSASFLALICFGASLYGMKLRSQKPLLFLTTLLRPHYTPVLSAAGPVSGVGRHVNVISGSHSFRITPIAPPKRAPRPAVWSALAARIQYTQAVPSPWTWILALALTAVCFIWTRWANVSVHEYRFPRLFVSSTNATLPNGTEGPLSKSEEGLEIVQGTWGWDMPRRLAACLMVERGVQMIEPRILSEQQQWTPEAALGTLNRGHGDESLKAQHIGAKAKGEDFHSAGALPPTLMHAMSATTGVATEACMHVDWTGLRPPDADPRA